MNQFNSHMLKALAMARFASTIGEVPIGAVIIDKNNNIITEKHNLSISKNNQTFHAEILAINEACEKLQTSRLDGCDIYVTLEPCPMCASALSLVRIRRIYFAAMDEKGGGIFHGPKIFSHATCHHKPEVYAEIMASDANAILKSFFQNLRKN